MASMMESQPPTTVGPSQESEREEPEVVRVVLRPRRTVRWTEDTVDNEGLGKKKSKICCIFHKRRDFDTDVSEAENAGSEDDWTSEEEVEDGHGFCCGHHPQDGHHHGVEAKETESN